ncbi:MAG: hypothetical protein KDD56_05855 [Bdellovibrionales bacterium]|nr:hypothetical protein [Bdellovibrionales bacterium]
MKFTKLLLLLLSLGFCTCLNAENNTYSFDTFRIEVPKSYTRLDSEFKQAVLVAKNSAKKTNLNIIEYPGKKNLGAKKNLAAEILENYQAIGLNSAKLEGFIPIKNLNGVDVIKARISYKSAEQTFVSYIGLFNGENKHFYLTLISENKQSSDESDFDVIINSLFTDKNRLEKKPNSSPWLTIVIFFLLSIGIIVLLRSKKYF